VLTAPGADTFLFIMAAEFATEDRIATLMPWSPAGPTLTLTANRAQVLNIDTFGHETVLIPLGPALDAAIIQSLADPTADLASPLRGPFRTLRTPPTNLHHAAIKLCKLARLLPAAIVGTLEGGVKGAEAWAGAQNLLAATVDDVAGYDIRTAQRLSQVASSRVPLEYAENARIIAFRPEDGGTEHFAILIGDPSRSEPVLTRVHSECFTGDLLASLKCDCGDQLRGAIQQISAVGHGVLLYLAQEGRGIGLINKLRAYQLQDQGFDTVEANLRLGFASDERIFLPAATMLRLLGFGTVRLMTNNPDKVAGLERWGVTVHERVAHAFPANDHNAFYLSTKAKKSGHLL
ncbi:MAG TPA: GTP cyclohydrolase II, partial [Sneathiellales bacterium]|nr:GTP cyclohydrolase II [Sneathiellales bacterium]